MNRKLKMKTMKMEVHGESDSKNVDEVSSLESFSVRKRKHQEVPQSTPLKKQQQQERKPKEDPLVAKLDQLVTVIK